MRTARFETREEWLAEARDQIAETLYAAAGYDTPRIRVGVGYPSAGKRSAVIGECWSKIASEDSTHEIIIRIEVHEAHGPQGVLSILLHEMAHAVDGNEHGHGPEFKTIAESVGLAGKMTSTVLENELAEAFEAWTAFGDLGPYPQAAFGIGGRFGGVPTPPGGLPPIIKSSGPPKQGTRMLKAYCATENAEGDTGCGYTVRLTRKWAAVALPTCPNPECDNTGQRLTLERQND
jgi:hypothetical protein